MSDVNRRIAANKSLFKLQYTAEEQRRLTAVGVSLGMDEATIQDLLYTGSRSAKRIDAAALEQQMHNYVETVQRRGFPYKFDDATEYKKFGTALLGKVKSKFPDAEVCIQGSSLRKPEAHDIDIAVFIDKEQYAGIVKTKFMKGLSTRVAADSDEFAAIDTSAMGYDALLALADEVRRKKDDYLPKAVAKNFADVMTKGLIKGNQSGSPFKGMSKTLKNQFPEQEPGGISILIKGGAFDLQPSLKVTA